MPSRLPQMRWPEHPGGAPAGPIGLAGEHACALGQPPRHGENERHGHIGGVLGEDAGRIGHGDAALHRGGDVDVIDAVAEVRDQPQPLARLAEHGPVDLIGHRRHDDVGGLGGLDELRLGHGRVVRIEAGVEQFAHAHFDAVRQPAGDHDQRLLALCHCLPLAVDLDVSVRPVSHGTAPPRPFAATACSGLLNSAHRHLSREEVH